MAGLVHRLCRYLGLLRRPRIDSTRVLTCATVAGHEDVKPCGAGNTVFHDVLKLGPGRPRQTGGRGRGDAAAQSFTSCQRVSPSLFELSGDSWVRETESAKASRQSRFYHAGAIAPKRWSLVDANEAASFARLLGAVRNPPGGRWTRGSPQMGDAVRLVFDSTGLHLAGVGAQWARFSACVFGAKAHVVYDADLARPVYHTVTRNDPRLIGCGWQGFEAGPLHRRTTLCPV